MTDPLFDWIVEMTQQQRTVKGGVESRHFAHIKKSRAQAVQIGESITRTILASG